MNKAAFEVAKAADRKDAAKIVENLAKMQEACVTCHARYRKLLKK